MNIHELIERESHLTFARRGKEHHGPCPFCRCESKQFVIFTSAGRYWCRQCDKKGDAIQFVRDYKGLSFRQAKEYLGLGGNGYHRPVDNQNHHKLPASLHPPNRGWVDAAQTFIHRCQVALRDNAGAKALAWLHRRGLDDDTIREAGLGYNMADAYADRQTWGLAAEMGASGRPKRLWLPRGVVIPWLVDGALWGLRIRRPLGDPKYYWAPGGVANALYNAGALAPGRPAMLLEGEIDALTVQQWAGDLVTAVATGSTHAGRRTKWIARLSLASMVLVAYDSDEAGDHAAAYWLDALPNARRWRPYWSDANEMAQDGVNVRAWAQAGLPKLDTDRKGLLDE
jgi:DNA primase